MILAGKFWGNYYLDHPSLPPSSLSSLFPLFQPHHLGRENHPGLILSFSIGPLLVTLALAPSDLAIQRLRAHPPSKPCGVFTTSPATCYAHSPQRELTLERPLCYCICCFLCLIPCSLYCLFGKLLFNLQCPAQIQGLSLGFLAFTNL